MVADIWKISFFLWFIFIIAWMPLSMRISRENINILCRVIITMDICLFLITKKYFKIWLLFFYISAGAFLLCEKFEKRPRSQSIRRESVSSMQDCIVITGTFMIAVSVCIME